MKMQLAPDPQTTDPLFFDTVTLSNFALTDRLDLLTGRYGLRACVTNEVLNEITDGVVAGYPALRKIEEAIEEGNLRAIGVLSGEERESYRQLLRVLGPGEASCVSCAKARNGIVVTDDRTARDLCVERNLRFTGTIGILKAAALDRSVSPSEADSILRAMVAGGFHSPVNLISPLL